MRLALGQEEQGAGDARFVEELLPDRGGRLGLPAGLRSRLEPPASKGERSAGYAQLGIRRV